MHQSGISSIRYQHNSCMLEATICVSIKLERLPAALYTNVGSDRNRVQRASFNPMEWDRESGRVLLDGLDPASTRALASSTVL